MQRTAGAEDQKSIESREGIDASSGARRPVAAATAADAGAAPARSEAADTNEPDEPKPNRENEELGCDAGQKFTVQVHVESPVPPMREEEVGAESETPATFRSRLVEGVPVLKHAGGRGKPKAKVLWVTPDLSEIYYTQAGR